MKRARKEDDEWRLTMMMGGGLGALLLVGVGGWGGDPALCLRMCLD